MSVVADQRTADATHAPVGDAHRRAGGRVMRRMTSAEYPAQATATREAYGQVVTPPRAGRPGRPRKPYTVAPAEVTCAAVRKEREDDRVVEVAARVVSGTRAAVAPALLASAVSTAVDARGVERDNGTDRSRCSRKTRKSYACSKDWEVRRAATAFSAVGYDFCRPVGTLRERGADGRWPPRTPAMAARLTDHVWSLAEWLAFPVV